MDNRNAKEDVNLPFNAQLQNIIWVHIEIPEGMCSIDFGNGDMITMFTNFCNNVINL